MCVVGAVPIWKCLPGKTCFNLVARSERLLRSHQLIRDRLVALLTLVSGDVRSIPPCARVLGNAIFIPVLAHYLFTIRSGVGTSSFVSHSRAK